MTEVNTSDDVMPAREAGVGPNKNSVLAQRIIGVYYNIIIITVFQIDQVIELCHRSILELNQVSICSILIVHMLQVKDELIIT